MGNSHTDLELLVYKRYLLRVLETLSHQVQPVLVNRDFSVYPTFLRLDVNLEDSRMLVRRVCLLIIA